MSLKIHKHYDYQTPFSAAANKDELAEIMRLKYPKACSNLETGAEFFARMVEDVQKYEAWRVIGFDSFEAFCREKLGKTLEEVESIVNGVNKLRGEGYKGPITEKQAKEASRSQRAAEMVKAGTHTQAEAAREIGISREAVRQACQVKERNAKTLDKVDVVIRLALDPTRTAANIRAKMGEEYAARLKEAL